MNYLPSTSEIEILRRLFQNRVGDAWYAVLGDRLGTGARTDVPGKPGWVYVMFLNGGDANGNVTYTAPTMVRAAGVAFPNVPGTGVWVGYGYDGDLCVKAAHNKALDAMGINTQVLNPLNQQSRFVYPWQLTYGLVSAVGNSTTPSTLVTVKKIRHYTGGNLLQPFETPLQADKIDLASYIPAADTHCYAMVWLDTYTNDPSVTTSITQALSSPLSDADLQECVVRSASSRPPDAIPFKAFYLSNDQGSITQSDLDVDVRQWLDMPNVLGFPNVLTTLERIRANYTFVTGPFTTSGVGALDTSETGARLIIVHKSNLTNTAPTATDDEDAGYSVGSQWFDTSSGTLYVTSDVTAGAAVWAAVGSGGGFTSFDVAGDSGTPQTITDGNTLNILGGTGLSSVASSTDTLTVNLDNTAVTPGSYTNMSATVDAQGRLTAASSGATPITSFTLAGDTGTPQTISNGDTLTVSGGVGLTATAGATDKVTLDLDNTAVTPASYTNTNLTVDAQGRITAASNGTAPVNPPFVDTQTIIKGSVDATKLLRIEVDGFTTATTRVLTPPDYDGTIATLAGTETFTNKTLTSPKVNEILDSNGNEVAKFAGVSSAVNELTITNAATGTRPQLSVSGGDSNAGMIIKAKGTGVINVDSPITFNEDQDSSNDVQISGGTLANLMYVDVSVNAIGFGTGAPNTNTIIHVSSTTKASIPAPSMTTTQRDAIGSPAAGMLVYLNDQYDFSMYDANVTDWVNIRRPYRQEFLLHPFSRHTIVSGTAMAWVSNTGQSGGGYWRQGTPAINNHTAYGVALGPGTYLVEFIVVKNASSGIMTLVMDGADISSHDLYSAAGVFNFRDVSSTFNISTPGTHTFGVKTTSKNASSSNYDMLLSWFQFVRTAEYP